MAWCGYVFLGINSLKSPDWAGTLRFGYISEYDLYRGSYWGLITTAFVHIEPVHLMFNMYWLWLLGGALERSIGVARYAGFILAAAFVSSSIELLTGQTGIGFSGVGYAFFGFGWVARKRYPELARIVTDRTAAIFVIWGVFCIFATQFGFMHIGNLAHASGFAFGVAMAALSLDRQAKQLGLAGLGVLVLCSGTALFWNPRSVDWVALQAEGSFARGDYDRATHWYLRSLELGADPKWAWFGLTEIYGMRKDWPRYKEALGHLRELSPEVAKEVEVQYGTPAEPDGK